MNSYPARLDRVVRCSGLSSHIRSLVADMLEQLRRLDGCIAGLGREFAAQVRLNGAARRRTTTSTFLAAAIDSTIYAAGPGGRSEMTFASVPSIRERTCSA